MSGDLPFGFGAPDDRRPPEGFDVSQLGAMLQQLGRMLQQQQEGGDGPVSWSIVRDTARGAVVQQGDPSVTESQRQAVREAVELAELWLDPATAFPTTRAGAGAEAWSRSEWIEGTLPAWQRIVEPIAQQVQAASQAITLDEQGMESMLPGGLPPEAAQMLGPMLGPLMGMMRQLGSAMFSVQVGQGLAALSTQVVGLGDIGVPLSSDHRAVLLPRNVAEFGEGLGIPEDEVRLYLGLREAAHQRLFDGVPWLRARLEGAIEEYARGIQVDPSRLQEALRDIDPSNPAAIEAALGGGMLEAEDSPEQRAALSRLETLLALVEGWVDDVVTEAAGDRLPSAGRLSEAMRRRRAAGGPAERTFATLIGLELRPRRLREAATLWRLLRESGGAEGRDARWAHPDLLPAADDLDDPQGYLDRSAPDGP